MLWFVAVTLAALIASQFVYPDVSSLRDRNPGRTAFMKHRLKEWRRAGLNYEVRQKWVPYDAVSPHVVQAVLIGEDDKFWQHRGFDYDEIGKAIKKDILEGEFVRGASTVSQQLTKNLYLSPSKNPLRKIREAVITWRLEHALSKKRILEIYLNVVEWGDRGIFGIESASRHYFGKPASSVGPREAAMLAAVLPNPRKYSPTGDDEYVRYRASHIYDVMQRRNLIPE